jgi:hypothetical protein
MCPETELGLLAIIFHVNWQPLLQYMVTWETERHFVFLPTIEIKGAGCIEVYVRVWHLLIKKKLLAYHSFVLQSRNS